VGLLGELCGVFVGEIDVDRVDGDTLRCSD
jgi:hypothetical protein